ncbi:hypothetical protein MTR_3g114040 [Medicago truncatula]|uniref:Uncharacterized protein n=1 Tax=Medicago truncatula TaxID=3880 RepID=G7J595_MEDTR|nr:hypothetical protein MTR_3g114040 [Medicago truncatula]
MTMIISLIVVELEALDLSSFQMKMLQKMRWMESQKAWQGQNPKSDGSDSSSSPQLNNGSNSMVYVGGFDQSEISWATCINVWESQTILTITTAMWLLCRLFHF